MGGAFRSPLINHQTLCELKLACELAQSDHAGHKGGCRCKKDTQFGDVRHHRNNSRVHGLTSVGDIRSATGCSTATCPELPGHVAGLCIDLRLPNAFEIN